MEGESRELGGHRGEWRGGKGAGGIIASLGAYPQVALVPLALRVGLGLLIKSKNLIKHGVKVEYFIP